MGNSRSCIELEKAHKAVSSSSRMERLWQKAILLRMLSFHLNEGVGTVNGEDLPRPTESSQECNGDHASHDNSDIGNVTSGIYMLQPFWCKPIDRPGEEAAGHHR